MAILTYTLTGTTDSEVTPIIKGIIQAVQFDITATSPNTVDITVAETGGLGRTIASGADLSSDAIRYPSVELTAADGTGAETIVPVYVSSQLTISMAQGDSDNVVTVRILYQPDSVS